jgi:hypothetical protein
MDHKNVDIHSIESNMSKITTLENTLNKFIQIFSNTGVEDLNETIQDE